jgi:hypothetical protein
MYRKLGTDSAMAYKGKSQPDGMEYDRSVARQGYLLFVGEAKQT